MRKRPISKQKRIKATARRRLMHNGAHTRTRQFLELRSSGVRPRSLLCGLDFFDAGGLAAECTHVIKLRPTDTPGTDDLNLVDDLRMKREDAFHAVSKGHLADRERFASATMFLRDTDSFKHLDALLVAFPDLHVHLYGIAGSEFRDIRPQLLFFNHV